MNDYTLVIDDDGGDYDLAFVAVSAASARDAITLYVKHTCKANAISRREAIDSICAVLQGRVLRAIGAGANDNCAFYDI